MAGQLNVPPVSLPSVLSQRLLNRSISSGTIVLICIPLVTLISHSCRSMDALHLALITHGCYFYMVTNYFNPIELLRPTWYVNIKFL